MSAEPIPVASETLEARLRRIGAERYHNLHRFHRKLHGGALTRGQVQAWALNRYYYQRMIPIKDAIVISRLEDQDMRRAWRGRLEYHDGREAGDSGIDRWYKLTDGLGLDRDYVRSTEGILPATRFAVDAYVHFVRDRTPLEAVASSLTELFASGIHRERIAGMLANYDFIGEETLSYFRARVDVATREADFVLAYVKTAARTVEQQDAVCAALEFKCAVLWTMLDALEHAYVDGQVPPDAFVPEGGT